MVDVPCGNPRRWGEVNNGDDCCCVVDQALLTETGVDLLWVGRACIATSSELARYLTVSAFVVSAFVVEL